MEIKLFSKRRLKEAYDNVLGQDTMDVRLILNDIHSKTFVNKPITGDETSRAEKEGKRQIGLHIQNMLDLDMKHFTELDISLKRTAKELKL